MEGWVDNTHVDAFTHTVSLSDDDRAVEVAVVALPSPTYEIRHARCRALAGGVAPTVVEGVSRLTGTPMVGGLTRRVAVATGAGEGAALVDRKSTRLNSSHGYISYAVFCLKKKKSFHLFVSDVWHISAAA